MKSSKWVVTLLLLAGVIIASTTTKAQTKPTMETCLKQCVSSFAVCIRGVDTPAACEKDRLKCNKECEEQKPAPKILNFDGDSSRGEVSVEETKTSPRPETDKAPGATSAEEKSVDESTGATSREETPTREEPSPAAKAGKMICPPAGKCALSEEHYDQFQAQIKELKGELEAARAKITTLESAGATPSEKEAAANRLKTLEENLTGLRNQLEKAKKMPTKIDLVEAPIPSWAGWHWGVLFSNGFPVFSGSDHRADTLGLTAFARWLNPSHFGLEAGLSPGVWYTEGQLPFALSGHFYGVAGWENGVLFLGPEAWYLQSPITGKQGYGLSTLNAGGEVKVAGCARFRLTLALPVYSPLKRLSGFWINTSIGIYF